MTRTTPKRPVACAITGAIVAALAATATVQAHDSEVSITESGGQRCIVANGLPDHATGQFPNAGNPHTISEQDIRLCVAANPVKNSQPTMVRGSVGVAINGVQFRPGTADYWDPSSPRGFSRDRSSGWNLEGLGAADLLGMDQNNAHVDERGLYHYHGVADALADAAHGTLIGYAADGFEIHYVGDAVSSSYRLKSGTRTSGPGGAHDGTYNEDWEYVAGSGTLDQCNGGMLNGAFVYFATDTYPFFPRCMWGDISSDFVQGPPAQANVGNGVRNQGRASPGNGFRRPGQRPQTQSPRNVSARFGPPQEAMQACAGATRGSACTFTAPQRGQQISGTCAVTPEGTTACIPAGGPPPRR